MIGLDKTLGLLRSGFKLLDTLMESDFLKQFLLNKNIQAIRIFKITQNAKIVLRRCFFWGSFLPFMFRVCHCHAVLSVMGQVWYLNVSISYLCLLPYFKT